MSNPATNPPNNQSITSTTTIDPIVSILDQAVNVLKIPENVIRDQDESLKQIVNTHLSNIQKKFNRVSNEYASLLYTINHNSIDWKDIAYLETTLLMRMPKNQHFTFKQIIILNYLRYYVKHYMVEKYGNMNLSKVEQENFKFILDTFSIEYKNMDFDLFTKNLKKFETSEFKNEKTYTGLFDAFRETIRGIDLKYLYLKSHYTDRDIHHFLTMICRRFRHTIIEEINERKMYKTFGKKKKELVFPSLDTIDQDIQTIKQNERIHIQLDISIRELLYKPELIPDLKVDKLPTLQTVLASIDKFMVEMSSFNAIYRKYIVASEKKGFKERLSQQPIPVNEMEVRNSLDINYNSIDTIVENIKNFKASIDLSKDREFQRYIQEQIEYIMYQYNIMNTMLNNIQTTSSEYTQKRARSISNFAENLVEFRLNCIKIYKDDLLNYFFTDKKSNSKKYIEIIDLKNQIKNIPNLSDSLNQLYQYDVNQKDKEDDITHRMLLTLIDCVQSDNHPTADRILNELFLNKMYENRTVQNKFNREDLLRYVKTILKYEYLIGIVFTKFIHHSTEILSKN